MRRIPQNRIQPKISTLPRQRSEAAAFLDIYKLVVEKKRLQQELENMEQRRQQIASRLVTLDAQVADLEKNAQQIRSQTDSTSTALKTVLKEPSQPQNNRFKTDSFETDSFETDGFETFFLEY